MEEIMTIEVLELLPFLFLAITVNIILGTFNSVKVLHNEFSFDKLKDGVYKSMVIAYSFLGLSIIWDRLIGILNVGGFELAPSILIKGVIILYANKGIKNLSEILNYTEKDGE